MLRPSQVPVMAEGLPTEQLLSSLRRPPVFDDVSRREPAYLYAHFVRIAAPS